MNSCMFTNTAGRYLTLSHLLALWTLCCEPAANMHLAITGHSVSQPHKHAACQLGSLALLQAPNKCVLQRRKQLKVHSLFTGKLLLIKDICKCLPTFNRARSCTAGIVQGKGFVQQVKKQNNFSTIQIQFPAGKTDAIQTGASVAINGTCLTVSSALFLLHHCLCNRQPSAISSDGFIGYQPK